MCLASSLLFSNFSKPGEIPVNTRVYSSNSDVLNSLISFLVIILEEQRSPMHIL